MPDIKATGATFNAIKAAALGEYDVPRALDNAAGAKFGKISTTFKSTVSDAKITDALVQYAKSGRTANAEATKRIKNILSLAGKDSISGDAALINPVNILAAITCLEKNEEQAALRLLKLFFLMKQAEFQQLDEIVPKYFGGDVRQAVSGGFGEFGKEKITGFAGMSKAAQLALDAINNKL